MTKREKNVLANLAIRGNKQAFKYALKSLLKQKSTHNKIKWSKIAYDRTILTLKKGSK